MRLSDWLKGIGLLLLTPLIVVIAMLAVIFFAWPYFCIGLVFVFLVAMLSEVIAWILFGLILAFILLILIAKSTI